MCVCTGKIDKKPVVKDDQIVIRQLMSTVFTCDHRFADAGLSLKMFKMIQEYIEDPENFNIDNYPDSIPYSEIEKKEKA